MSRIGLHRRPGRSLSALLLILLALVSCWKVEADLQVSTTLLDFGTDKEIRSFTVLNDSEDNSLTSGVTSLEYRITSSRSWLTVSPASGSCGEMQKNTHTVTVDRSQMQYGVNNATLSISSNGGSTKIAVSAIRPVPGCSDAPTAPANPSPPTSATGVSTSVTLSWEDGRSQCDPLKATYDIYFGTTTPPPFDHNNDTLTVWTPPALNENTLYYWRVVAKDANGATSAREWTFRTVCTLAPGAVALASPAAGAVNVSINADLAWTGGNSQCGGMNRTYDVYFGKTSPPPFVGNTTIKGWDPGTMSKGATYFWRVVAKDANGSVSSAEASFTTEAALCTAKASAVALLTPANSATNVPVATDLTWSGGDSQCPGLTATYDVYFGTTTPPPFHHDNGTSKVWDAPLDYNAIYYWRVVAKDANGSTSSNERTFRTPCNLPPTTPTLLSPADGAAGVDINSNLTWSNGNSQCSGETATFDVYFGVTSPPPLVGNSGTTKAWDPGLMLPGVTYHWKVVAKDGFGQTSSVERSFTTAVLICTSGPGALALQAPADGTTGVAFDADLVWSGGNSQCAGLTATYDVYFGTTTPPSFHHDNGATKTWDPGTLSPSTTYYWRIVAKDGNGTSLSPEYDFTTAAAPCVSPPGAPSLASPVDGAVDVSIDANLTWSGGNSQCAGLAATYDVYFGATTPPPFHHNNGATKTWDPGTLSNSTTYYWRVVATDANGSTSSGTYAFTTVAPPCLSGPAAPTLVSPANGATGIATDANLTWSGGNSQCAGLTATYDVYFGTTTPPSFHHNNGATKTWDPGTLSEGTTYYWQIVAKDDNGTNAGAVWSFTTQVPCVLPPTSATVVAPANSATNIGVNDNLAWSGGNSQCAGLTATYDVYFGTSNPPSFDHDNGTSKTWDPGTLQYLTTYYWQIVAKDGNGETPGPVWSFTTEEPCLSPPTAACSPTPSNNRTGVNENQDLAWGCGDSQCGLSVTYDVYFGTTPTPGEAQKLGSTTSKLWALPKQARNTQYYWKVVTRDANGTVDGPVWTYKTRL